MARSIFVSSNATSMETGNLSLVSGLPGLVATPASQAEARRSTDIVKPRPISEFACPLADATARVFPVPLRVGFPEPSDL